MMLSPLFHRTVSNVCKQRKVAMYSLFQFMCHKLNRSHLQHPDAVPDNFRQNIPESQDERYKLQSLLQHRPIKVRRSELPEIKAGLTEYEANCVLDLRAFMQLHPWTLPADAPLSHAYRVLRTMGLRHLYVTQPKPTIVGLLTRKNLTEEAASLKIGEVLQKEGTVYHMLFRMRRIVWWSSAHL